MDPTSPKLAGSERWALCVWPLVCGDRGGHRRRGNLLVSHGALHAVKGHLVSTYYALALGELGMAPAPEKLMGQLWTGRHSPEQSVPWKR